MKSRPNPSAVPLFIPLESVSVASPCNADWDAMHGDDRSRFCSGCAKNVYNLSALTKSEAETLLLEKEGKLCVRYFQRPDGTMLTQDCPIGLLRANEALLQPQFVLWANAIALRMIISALVVGALSPVALLAQPFQTTGTPGAPTAKPTPTTTPTATPTPSSPPVRAEMGDLAVNIETVGQMQVPAPTSTPIKPNALMGKVAAPPVCAPVQRPTPSIPVLMGLVAPRATMGEPSVRTQKTTTGKVSNTKIKKKSQKGGHGR